MITLTTIPMYQETKIPVNDRLKIMIIIQGLVIPLASDNADFIKERKKLEAFDDMLKYQWATNKIFDGHFEVT
jgi:hypothetical protein